MKIYAEYSNMIQRMGVRFSVGTKLTPEEKHQVLKSLKDSYKELKRPYTIESVNGYDKKVWTDNASDYMVKSDITGKKLRWYVTLLDKRIAHPTELYPNIFNFEVNSYQDSIERMSSEADTRYNIVVTEIKRLNQISHIINHINIAMENGAYFYSIYDSSDKAQKNPFTTLKFEAKELSLPEYILQKEVEYLELTNVDLYNYRTGIVNVWLNHYYAEIDWLRFYNEYK